ncbi:MAG: hypothetical protein GXO21_07175 [Aquificae bacterium]|nr:hypothetical protein [Aquificota bacterium]
MQTYARMTKKIFSVLAIFLIGCGSSSDSGSNQENNIQTPKITKIKGEFSTGNVFSNDSLEWASNFRIVEIGDYLDIKPSHIQFLKSKGVEKVFAYEWMPAGYHYIDGEDNPFMAWVYQNREITTLNPNGPFPHCQEMGYSWCEDYYYDLANNEVVDRRISFLKNNTLNKGIDGIFFDWGSGIYIEEDIYKPMKDRFFQLHPQGDYFQAVSDFYRKLKEEGLSVFTNQGFRKAQYHLPVVDYDMTESYITTDYSLSKQAWIEYKDDQGKTVLEKIDIPITAYYPVSEDILNGSLEDTAYYIDYLNSLKKQYGGNNFKKFVYVNYVAPDLEKIGEKENLPVYKAVVPKNALFFSYAMGKISGEIVYTEVPLDHSLERIDVYFYDLGEPLEETYQKIENQKYIRFFSNGFVLAGLWEKQETITISSKNLKNGFVYDLYNKNWLKIDNNTLEVQMKPYFDKLQNKIVPIGRVFIYSSD